MQSLQLQHLETEQSLPLQGESPEERDPHTVQSQQMCLSWKIAGCQLHSDKKSVVTQPGGNHPQQIPVATHLTYQR